jgi:hypothetical protein
MSNTNRLPLDLSDWLESLALHQRLTLLNRNITAGMADGVIVAEIVDCIYPKIVQVNNIYNCFCIHVNVYIDIAA